MALERRLDVERRDVHVGPDRRWGKAPLPQASSAAFIDTLVTVRYEQSRAFELCASEIRRSDSKPTSRSALVGLVEALVDRTSELLEGAASAADDMALAALPYRRVAKVRESLVG